jgi:protein-S-isoprenylcysteine O-methyltransferase Ste14
MSTFIVKETFSATRLVVTLLMLAFLRLVNIAPNEGNESQEGDKVATGGAPNKRFEKQVAFAVVESLFPLYHLYNYGSSSLAIHEWILFGLAMCLFMLRIWCYQKLGKFFTYTIMVKKDHKLIDDGPYQYLIHPSYTGQVGVMILFVLYMLGFQLSFMWLLGLPIIGMILSVLKKRITIEENHMLAEFGETYKKYAEERYRLIPFVY